MAANLQQHQKIIPAGTILFSEGDNSKETYILLKGNVEVIKNNQHIVDINESGSFLGEMATLIGEVRSATIKTKIDSLCIVLDENNLEILIKQMPALGIKLAKTLARRLSQTTIELISEKQKLRKIMNSSNSLEVKKNITKTEIEEKLDLEKRVEILTEIIKEKIAEDDDYEEAMEQFFEYKREIEAIENDFHVTKLFISLEEISKKYNCRAKYFAYLKKELNIEFSENNTSDKTIEVKESIVESVPKIDTISNNEKMNIFKQGTLKAKEGKFEEAVVFFEKIIANDPKFVGAYMNCALSYIRLNNFLKAKELFEEVLNIEPENEKAKKNLALVIKKL